MAITKKVVVHLGRGFKNIKIVKKKPPTAIKIGGTKHFTRYARGAEEFVVPKKGVTLKRQGLLELLGFRRK